MAKTVTYYGPPQTITITLASLANDAMRVSAQYANTAPYVEEGVLTVALKTHTTGPVAGSYDVWLIAGFGDGTVVEDDMGVADALATTTWLRSGRLLKRFDHSVFAPGVSKVLRSVIKLTDLTTYFSILVHNNASGQILNASGHEIKFQPKLTATLPTLI